MGVKAAGNDPEYQFSLRSQMTVSPTWNVDFALRGVDNLPDPYVPRYIALDAHVGWTVTKDLNVLFTALNLLDKRHAEFSPSATGSEIGRAFYVKMLWDF